MEIINMNTYKELETEVNALRELLKKQNTLLSDLKNYFIYYNKTDLVNRINKVLISDK